MFELIVKKKLDTLVGWATYVMCVPSKVLNFCRSHPSIITSYYMKKSQVLGDLFTDNVIRNITPHTFAGLSLVALLVNYNPAKFFSQKSRAAFIIKLANLKE